MTAVDFPASCDLNGRLLSMPSKGEDPPDAVSPATALTIVVTCASKKTQDRGAGRRAHDVADEDESCVVHVNHSAQHAVHDYLIEAKYCAWGPEAVRLVGLAADTRTTAASSTAVE